MRLGFEFEPDHVRAGTARTGAYFAVAPFAGAAISILMLSDAPDMTFWIAAALMGAEIWPHLTERHTHSHSHFPVSHAHQHRHDFPWDGKEPHVHPHEHEPLTHEHPHFPDIHHRHKH